MARFVGAGFCAYLLTSIPLLGRPPGLVADWFTPLGVLFAFGPGAVLLAISFSPRHRALIPLVAMSCTVGYLTASALWFVAWNGWEADAEQVSWLMAFSGLPSMAWILVRPAREAVAVLVICSTVAAIITDTGRSDVIESSVFIETAWPVIFTLCFMLAAGRVVRTGRILDRTRATAMAAAGQTAAVAARNNERARFDALIHDQVIATLVAAYNNPDEPRLPVQAHHALAELEVLARGADESGEVDATEALARLRAAVTSADPDVTVLTDRDEFVDARYPLRVVRALAEAVGEAVRNSAEHAGAAAECAALVELRGDSLRVTVADDGVGFDPTAVPPERLGIEVSIRQRLRELPGAKVRLRSAPGDGATVQMAWEPP